jgi:hypothetical protein
MNANDAVTWLTALPENATYEEASAWLMRMRRLVDRWDDLPQSTSRSMTAQGKREVYAELDVLEEMIHRDMAIASS